MKSIENVFVYESHSVNNIDDKNVFANPFVNDFDEIVVKFKFNAIGGGGAP